MAHQRLEHGEFAGGERQFLAVLAQGAGAQVEGEGAEVDDLVLGGGRAGRFLRGAAAQHRVHAGQQFARVEGLAQVVVGADFQADDAVHVLALGREHDDRRAVVGGAQAPADRQAVLAGHHQVQYDQVGRLAQHQPVEGLAVLGEDDFETFLRQVAAQEVADARVVIHHQDLVGPCCSLGHGSPGIQFVTAPIVKGRAAGFGVFPGGLSACYKCCPSRRALTSASRASGERSP